MTKMTTKQLAKRDTARDIGMELLQAVREMKTGRSVRTHYIEIPAAARAKPGLS